MSLASKHYYLFNVRIWSVVVETSAEDVEETEDEDEIEATLDHKLDGSHTLSANDAPMFGFTPWTPHWITEDEE
jgi:hypothetical protein